MYWKEAPFRGTPSSGRFLEARHTIEIATEFSPTPGGYEAARTAGFRRAELWTDDIALAGWRAVAELAASSGLGHAPHFPDRLEQPPETLERVVALSKALDASAVVVHQPHFDRYSAGLYRLAPDLRLAVENHELGPEGFLDWAGRNPGPTLDVEHLWKFTLRDAPWRRSWPRSAPS
jgi:sugar phosphate isomerase/epimerase